MKPKANTTVLLCLTIAAGIAMYAGWRQPTLPAAPATASKSDPLSFVPSMLGTRPDGQLRQQGPDQLLLTPELVYLFDYYLAAMGEKPLAAIRAEIRHELERRLQGKAVAEAWRLLDAYLGYKRALADVEAALPASTHPVEAARRRLLAMQHTRSSYFSAGESAALFGTSDAYDEDAIARMEISSDRKLSEAQRQQHWQALDARLTPAQREERAAPGRVLALEQAVAQARERGAGDNEIYRLRAATFSPAAADRLAELDKEEADWQRRIASYQTSRRALMDQGRSNGAAMQQLRDASFSPAEQLRLGAYEQ
ncbi:lipase secretion chaperone [Duganella qianjiadongensis]|uniref:Lipase helper protein n=1 Tax=Duganella qianjiadongensis TaxID=2692176 RepID=A0ABW9VN60_9BURK|nr:lipase secretion chaperone [Duganella qianjiadongensis]MYM39879.1 lipase chaperone [Duganella qianjiadongensis]